ncbi:carboxymuconolactone decarboxylase family protein [Duganella violaceipulchra]|uniref:AhpD family alkylhydroperoxidase n=1 Tax=Duganella violaceipulchra TaxID=2849652 RepID=A0AA41LBM2_9BURK|nr:carboxymuconolactone decarboxylase family protein [Duganella violaceicalia]MBV6325450.1 carboxymuconolactone decarboxylase family protein [Duganella violaceicalia]MCP2012649.1 AhpD family alkylhydroperoxidase [Duganella violaceicalia]
MKQRLDYHQASPDALNALIALELAVLRLGLDPRLLQLVKLRASQINGCAYCVDIESDEARRVGEAPRRLFTLSLWRESTLFSAQERAALAWTEALTQLNNRAAINEARALMSAVFDEQQIENWALAIVAINCWNRVGIGFRKAIL